jgi:Uma2 family endonuclease
MASNPVHKLTEEEYLAIERVAETKSEFLQGEMYAMSGVSLAHGRLQVNLTVQLSARMKAGCEVFSSDMRVKVAARRCIRIPISPSFVANRL